MPRTALSRNLMLSISVFALVACAGERTAPATKTAAPMPPVTEVTEVAAVPEPLGVTDIVMPASLPAAASGPLGVEERIARLEQTVGSLRTDYDRMMPAFASLNTTNERIQALLDDVERDAAAQQTAASSAAPVAMPAPLVTKTTTVTTASIPAVAPATTQPAIKEAAQPAKENAVKAVRIGEHGTKTRLVLDLTGKTKPEFKYDLDNGEKLLLVDLPSLAWNANASGKGGVAAPLVEGWSAQTTANGGATLAIQLKKSTRVLSTQFLPPEGKDPARLVLDIASGA